MDAIVLEFLPGPTLPIFLIVFPEVIVTTGHSVKNAFIRRLQL
jgi:hypothetical protein